LLAYIVRRLFVGIILLLVLSFVTFFLFFASPVDVTRYACGKNCTQERREITEKALGYDDPWPVQWAKYLKGLAVGRDFPDDKELQEKSPDIVTHCAAPCFGYSQVNGQTVNALIKDAWPVSVSLAFVALFIWVTLGILFGLLAAVTKGSLLDRGIVGVTLVVYAFPTFFVGIFLLKYVSIKWGWIPFPQYETIADGGIGGWLTNLLLPATTLALFYLAGYVRITRAFVLESLSEDYIRTAKAKGLKQRTVLMKHALRAALTPLVTMIGLDFASLLAGAIITESVFSFHGLGALAVRANVSYDLPTLIGLLLLAGAFVILANIVVDVLYAYIDPRVRLD
jgi:peptide/nickel transport system permease protein